MALLHLLACNDAPAPAVESAASPPTFVGTAACGECHVESLNRWKDSHHALAMQPATGDTTLGDFEDTEYVHFGRSTRFLHREDTFLVVAEDADGRAREFEVAYTFGITPLQQYLLDIGGGRLQALPIAWDSRAAAVGGQRWFHLYPDDPLPPGDPLHWSGRDQNWNYMCAECHSTNLDKGYDPASDTYATTWSEINVGCEGCHGPGSAHVEQARAGMFRSGFGLAVDLDDSGRAAWIMDPATGIASRSEVRTRAPVQPEACGRCHSRRGVATAEYEWDRPLADTHIPSLLDAGLYFDDGQIREEVYVYGSFLQSRMYRAGVTCADCHDPHTARLRTDGAPSRICSTCHLPDMFDRTSHHGHPEGAAECVDCHMTARTYMGVDDRRDHSFRIPDPVMARAIGAPDACTGCHRDLDAESVSGAYADWFGAAPRRHFGYALHEARAGGANAALLAIAADPEVPGIARGTALADLRQPFGNGVTAAIAEGSRNPDPLVRLGALRAAAALPMDPLLAIAAPLLEDSLRAVRIAAAAALSPARDSLPVQYRPAFENADREWVDSNMAIADRPEARIALAGRAADRGDLDAAEALYRQALAMEPGAVPARGNLADLLRSRGRDGEAETLLREGIAQSPDAAALHHALGLLHVRSGRQDAGLLELARAAELEPGNGRFQFVYGVALNSLGRSDEAISFLASAAERIPADFDIRLALATMLRDAGRNAEARQVANALRERFPDVDTAVRLADSLSRE